MGGTRGAHGGVRGAYNILVGRPEERRPLGRPRRRWKDGCLGNRFWGYGLDS
jgi:hypothetical protein